MLKLSIYKQNGRFLHLFKYSLYCVVSAPRHRCQYIFSGKNVLKICKERTGPIKNLELLSSVGTYNIQSLSANFQLVYYTISSRVNAFLTNVFSNHNLSPESLWGLIQRFYRRQVLADRGQNLGFLDRAEPKSWISLRRVKFDCFQISCLDFSTSVLRQEICEKWAEKELKFIIKLFHGSQGK